MIESMLKENNLKVTPKRVSIYNYLASTREHPTAEDIYNELKDEYPNMSLATVYKTLDTFTKNGMILELNTDLGYSRYDYNTDLHAHLFCNECKSLVDAEIEMSAEELLSKTKTNENFELDNIKLLIYGRCNKCLANH